MSATAEPTKVALYSYARNLRPDRVAEFTWDSVEGVALTVFDEEWGGLARDYVHSGLISRVERRRVYPADGLVFMRALIQPSRSTYYHFVDESRQ